MMNYDKETYPDFRVQLAHAAKLAIKRSPFGSTARALKNQLWRAPYHAALQRGRQDGWQSAAHWLLDEADGSILTEERVLRDLATRPNDSIEFELLLTELRRIVLFDETLALEGPLLGFLVALVRQLILNEYVYFETEQEKDRIKTLLSGGGSAAAAPQDPTRLALWLSLYRPIPSFYDRISEAMLDGVIARPLAELIEGTMHQHGEEQAYIAALSANGAFEDETSSAVGEQYEENPYPRWTNLDPAFAVKGHKLALLERHFSRKELAFTAEPMEVLIAGCGTGRHALGSVIGYGDKTNALAVDLSKASLAYALRKARELGADNIKFEQADILNLGSLGRQFDIVECIGTLHHMADPRAGWRALTELLRPGGLMNIGLYSAAARHEDALLPDEPINAVVGADEIRAFRHKIMTGEPERLDKDYCPLRRDFWYLSRCRDLVFHVMEHRFTIPQIKDCLAELGLEFRGFERLGLLEEDYWTNYPRGRDRFNLDAWAAFETRYPRTFGQLYMFWCIKPAG